MSNEIKNMENVAEESKEVAVVEEQKEGFVKKAGKWIKKNGLKAVAVGAVGVVGFLLGAHSIGKSDDSEYAEDSDVIDVDDYSIEDAE